MKYYLRTYAAKHFPEIADRKLREHAAACSLVRRFFEDKCEGVFIEVGANEPKRSSQTWHLEQLGWRGILVEPIPELCERLREERPRSITVQAACGASEQCGTAEFHVATDSVRSTLDLNVLSKEATFARTEIVALRTLDAIIAEHAPARIDFVSIDVEGVQLEVLRGLNLARHRPRLLLVEDHLLGWKTHRHLVKNGYQLVKRTVRNNWYIPREFPFSLTGPRERFLLWRKVWLHTPFRYLRIHVRQALHRT